MRINKHDTNGTKPLLGKGELGYDDYVAGGDAGRVYVGTGSENIALAEKSEVDSHAGRTDNPHSVTKAQVGLANVDNTSDANKPISTATQNALNAKVDTSTNQTIGGVKTFSSSPIVPAPTTGTQVANKDYADTKQSKSELAYDAGTSSYIPNTLSSGAVIERGSNANGEYVKFADGTLICTAIIVCSGNINIQLGSLYTTPSTTWNFPATFNNSDFHLSGCERYGVGNCFLSRADGANETASSCSFKGVRGQPINDTPNFALTAIGRWK